MSRRLTVSARRAVAGTAPAALAAAIMALALGAASAQEPTQPDVSTAREAFPAAETVVEIRVHGNLSLPDADVIALAGVALGDAAGPDRAEAVRMRLEASGRFETIEVRRLYRSLSATDRVALVIVVRERPGARFSNPVVRALAGLGRRLMVAPIVEHEEGYGVAYGALTSVVDAFGSGSRLSVPATWGGHKRVALEMEAPIRGPVVDRLRAGGSRGRRRHPYFDVEDDRTRFEVAVERRLPRGFRVNGEAAWEDIRFAAHPDRLIRSAVHLDYGDYRVTPATARRNTVVVRAGIERRAIADGGGRSSAPVWTRARTPRPAARRSSRDASFSKGRRPRCHPTNGHCSAAARPRAARSAAGAPTWRSAIGSPRPRSSCGCQSPPCCRRGGSACGSSTTRLPYTTPKCPSGGRAS